MASTLTGAIVFEYWIRLSLRRNIFVDELMNIVMKFYGVFEFDQLKSHPDLLFANGFKTAIHNGKDCSMITAYSKNIISNERMSRLQWEITLRAKKLNGWLMMGLMNEEYVESADTGQCIGEEQHQIALGIANNCYPGRSINGHSSDIQRNSVKWNIGDRVRLDFDLKGRQCIVFLNDQLLGVLTDDLPHNFCLGLTLWQPGTSFETTLFEII